MVLSFLSFNDANYKKVTTKGTRLENERELVEY